MGTVPRDSSNLKLAIKTNDLDGFKQEVRAGVVINTQHLIAAIICDSYDIVKYITTNYSTTDKVKLVDVTCCQVALRNGFPNNKSMILFLEFLSDVVYQGQKQFKFVNWSYGSFNYILQLENTRQDSSIKAFNRQYEDNFRRLADAYSRSGVDLKTFLHGMVINLTRVTPMEQDPGLFFDDEEEYIPQDAGTYLDEVSEKSESARAMSDEEIIARLRARQAAEMEAHKVAPVVSSPKPQPVKSQPPKSVTVRPEDFSEKDNKLAIGYDNTVCSLPIRDRLEIAGITIQEIIDFVHELEGR